MVGLDRHVEHEGNALAPGMGGVAEDKEFAGRAVAFGV